MRHTHAVKTYYQNILNTSILYVVSYPENNYHILISNNFDIYSM